jgi:hypothetical protein
MQLSIFDVMNDMPAIQSNNQEREYLGYKEYIGQKAHEKIQSFVGKTFLFQYESPFVYISVPVKISKFEGLEKPTPLIHLGRGYSLNGKRYESFLAGSYSNQVYQLLEDENTSTYRFTYPKDLVYKPMEEFLYSATSCLSSISLQETEYKAPKTLSHLNEVKELYSEEDIITGLIGKTVKVEFYLRDEIFWNIQSLPFEIKSIDIKGTEIWFTGSHEDVHFYANHYRKVRNQHPSILFDCFMPNVGWFSYTLKGY